MLHKTRLAAVGPRPARERRRERRGRGWQNAQPRQASTAVLVRLARRRARASAHRCGQRLIDILGTDYGAAALANVAQGLKATHSADLRRLRSGLARAGLGRDPALVAVCMLWVMSQVFGRLVEREAVALSAEPLRPAAALAAAAATAPAALSAAAWHSRRRKARAQRRQRRRAERMLRSQSLDL